MPNRRLAFIAPLLIVLIAICSCVGREFQAYKKALSDGRYDSEFPSRNASQEIGSIAQSVKKVYSVSRYTTWQFTRESRVLRFHLLSGLYSKMSVGSISTQETAIGTATVIMATGSNVAVLTCAHVVNSPDTLISWYDPVNQDQMPVIKSISIKEKQENWVRDLGECGSFTILAADPEQDIAILGKRCGTLDPPPVVFPYPYGNAGELEWGSFVYIFGYPMGNPVITKALVSKSVKGDPGDFTVDALLNKGYSGGIILAIRDGVPNFELVGMVKSVLSGEAYYLRPSSDDKNYYEIFPYKGDIYVGSLEQVQYGLNYTVPSGKILNFYNKNREALVREGYDLDPFFGLSMKTKQ
jgi:hypothetical protein